MENWQIILLVIGVLIVFVASIMLIRGDETYLLKNITKTPSDYIKENQIEIMDDKIIIYVENPSLSKYADTGSMIPLLNEYSNGIRIIPDSEEDIFVGDIVTFEKDNRLIVHRVIEKGSDEDGTFFVTKGDNVSISDGKIRFSDIKYKTIGVLW